MSIIIILIIAISVLLFSYIKVVDAFLGKRKTHITVLLLSCLPFLISAIVSNVGLQIHPIAVIIIQIISLFIITLNYKAFMIKRLATVGFFFLLINVIDNSFSLFLIIFPDFISNYQVLSFIRLSLIIAALFVTSFILGRFIDTNNTIDIPAIWLPALIVSGTAVFLGILYLAEIPHMQEIWIVLMWQGALFLFFYLSYSLSKIFEERLKTELQSQEKEYYSFQCKLMQESVDRVKSIRHDMKMHLVALKGYTVENKAAADYLNRLLEDIDESVIYSDTGNMDFDSIINYKLRDAGKDAINLDIKMSIPPVMNVDVVDIVTIIGNLLDNALDAVAKVNERFIKLDVELAKGGLFIKMDNSFNGEINYSDEKQIVSLKSGDRNGYGLKNIRQSVEKYNGYMKITHIENVFSVGIFIYMDD